MHFGSVISALGSYLQAKRHNGQWFVRIEDVDLPRTIFGSDKVILNQLETIGLTWDSEIIYQSERTPVYHLAIETLSSLGHTFSCSCTRKKISIKPHSCACSQGIADSLSRYSIRIRTDNQIITVNDLLQGKYTQSLMSDVGDFIVKRTDGLFAYHLAVTVDDAEQNINQIVRGADLLNSTPRQIYIQKLLGLPTPTYLHLPVAINKDGSKVSKRSHAAEIDLKNPSRVIFEALQFLGQMPPSEAIHSDLESLMKWAIKNWDINSIPKEKEIKI